MTKYSIFTKYTSNRETKRINDITLDILDWTLIQCSPVTRINRRDNRTSLDYEGDIGEFRSIFDEAMKKVKDIAYQSNISLPRIYLAPNSRN